MVLYIDDFSVDSSTLPLGSSTVVVSSEPPDGRLYIGGVPEGIDVGGQVASSLSLLGCISNIIVNGE